MNIVFLPSSQRDEPATAMNLPLGPGRRNCALTRAAASVLRVTAKAWTRQADPMPARSPDKMAA
jgi:hypothetical protein